MNKRILFSFMFSMVLLNVSAESANNTVLQIEKQVSSLQQKNAKIEKELKELSHQNRSMKTDIDSLHRQTKAQSDSIAVMAEKQIANASKFDSELSKTNSNVEASISTLSQRTTMGVAFVVTILLVIAAVAFFLRRRISKSSSSIDDLMSVQGKLQEAQTKLQEESIKLDDKLIEVLDKQLPAATTATAQDGVLDHSLALKVADEIVRIEINLSRMDASIKGYKQLSKAVERIKNNFLANGYEMVEMLGKPYVEGMKAVANFVTDETLKSDEQIITGVIKPQVNYNGKMIQAAQITVSQGA